MIPHHADLMRIFKHPLRYLEQAAEYSAQGEKDSVAPDVLWVDAAQTAVEMEEFGKANGYLLKVLAQNPQNPSARQLLRELSILDISPR